MTKENKAAAAAVSGESVTFVTNDALNGQVTSADVCIDALDWNSVNPATGPLFVEGALPGDLLKVEILKIKVGDSCAMLTGAGLGVCAGHFDKIHARVMPMESGHVVFPHGIKIPLRPMVGVIGVAPASGSVNCGTPGDHGGNMDCKEIREGAAVYFRVSVEGALLAMGDLHGVMGDGEVSGCGAESPGEVTVRVSVIKDRRLPTPFISNDAAFMAIASAETIGEAIDRAALNGVDFIMAETGMSREEAVSLVSLACDVRVCQIVDPLKTARLEIPRALLSGCNIAL